MELFDPLALPNGSAKATMEENMADADQAPSDKLMRLSPLWALILQQATDVLRTRKYRSRAAHRAG